MFLSFGRDVESDVGRLYFLLRTLPDGLQDLLKCMLKPRHVGRGWLNHEPAGEFQNASEYHLVRIWHLMTLCSSTWKFGNDAYWHVPLDKEKTSQAEIDANFSSCQPAVAGAEKHHFTTAEQNHKIRWTVSDDELIQRLVRGLGQTVWHWGVLTELFGAPRIDGNWKNQMFMPSKPNFQQKRGIQPPDFLRWHTSGISVYLKLFISHVQLAVSFWNHWRSDVDSDATLGVHMNESI